MDKISKEDYLKKYKKNYSAPQAESKVDAVISEASNMDSRFDPNGSYTGKPLEPGDVPTQDADDL